MAKREFCFYDYECTGLSYMYDRPVQFAGIRTDENLNPIAGPIDIKCRLPDDVIMNPFAAMVHGLTPQELNGVGMDEPEFASKIHQFFHKSGTTQLGYNTESYDKHFTRHMSYRCMLPAYDLEWRNGCSRWDVITVLKGIYAVSRNSLNWPLNEEGNVTFKLSNMCEANSICNDNAHDASSDIRMTIDLLRCIKESAPEWYDFFLQHKDKQSASSLLALDQPLNKRFVIHSDYIYGRETCYVAPLVPLFASSDPNKVICIDLRGDIDELNKLNSNQIEELLYMKKDDLPKGVNRPCIATVTLNSCPLLIPRDKFSDDKFELNNIDKAHCQEQFKKLIKFPEIEGKLRDVFSKKDQKLEEDVDGQLYFGSSFVSQSDLDVIKNARQQNREMMAKASIYLEDPRMKELLFRYRARYLPDTLTENETIRWKSFVKSQLVSGRYTISDFWKDLADVADKVSGIATDRDKSIIEELRNYGISIERKISSY